MVDALMLAAFGAVLWLSVRRLRWRDAALDPRPGDAARLNGQEYRVVYVESDFVLVDVDGAAVRRLSRFVWRALRGAR